MTSSARLRFDIEDAPSDADVEVLPNGLEAFNESRWPGHQQWRPLAVFARDGESIVAGLAGETYSGWLFIRYLWVSDALRGQGIGRKLIGDAEARALERGCHSAWVDTFSFQAPGLYGKLGYTMFGELDYPPGHKRFFLQKRLGDGVRAQGYAHRFQGLECAFAQLFRARGSLVSDILTAIQAPVGSPRSLGGANSGQGRGSSDAAIRPSLRRLRTPS
jgi:GNAT superfamily N-acetyltransferase